jgi:hypothetical protein
VAGFYKFRAEDVENLAVLLDNLPKATFPKRMRMVLHCLASTHEYAEWAPCPFFTLGVRTLAERVGETPASVQRFFSQMERDGWIVRLGKRRNKGGEWTLRTFFWMAEGVSPHKEEPIQGVYRPNDTPQPESPAKTDTGVYWSASKKPSSESWPRYTSEVPEGTSEEGSPAPGGAAPQTAESALAEIFRMRDDGWEPEWLK